MFAHLKSAHSDCVACDECKFTSESICDLKTHQEKLHGKYCHDCKHTFAGEKRLKKHVCKIQISNPCSGRFYTKDWFVKDYCIRVFDKDSKEEVYLLHCDHCLSIDACKELPVEVKQETCFKDTQGVTHLGSDIDLESNSVNWRAISEMTHIMNISNMVLKR